MLKNILIVIIYKFVNDQFLFGSGFKKKTWIPGKLKICQFKLKKFEA